MPVINTGSIYTSPRTQSHMRAVLFSIRSIIDLFIGYVGEVSAVADAAVATGQAVYVSSAGHINLAEADSTTARAIVIGLATTDAGASGTGSYIAAGRVTLDSWAAITGTTLLTPGAIYFLSTVAGGLTATPTTTVGHTVVRVGVAISTTTLEVRIEPGILL